MKKCKCCGEDYEVAHAKYSDRCIVCGKRYAKYANYKSMAKKGDTKAEQRLEEIRLDYLLLGDQGFVVPRELQKEVELRRSK